MNSLASLLGQLEAHVQEELGAQMRTLELLAAQERALTSGEAAKIAAATLQLERELRTTPARSRRRDELLAALAKLWNVAPGALSLTSVIDRASDDGERLRRQRGELREVVAKIARSTRRNAFNARVQERVNADVLRVVLAAGASQPIPADGVLIDAEA